MKVLLHICCAPCSCMCIRSLRDEQMDVTGFWYNPNIHPFTEYRARRNCLREYAGEIRLPLLEEDRYALRPFIRLGFALCDDGFPVLIQQGSHTAGISAHEI